MKEKYKQLQDVVDILIPYLRNRDNRQREGEDEVWKRIEVGIAGKKKSKNLNRFYLISAVAASLLLILSVVNEFYQPKELSSLDNYVGLLKEPTMTSQDIQLYLSPEEPVVIKEKEVSVAYSARGTVSINEKEQVVETKKAVEQEFDQIVVPKGKYTHLTLSDGSTMHINSGTRVVYPRVFLPDCREIYVEGEVYLDVVKNKKAPFVVKTPKFEVEVLGTTFNVNAYKEDGKGEVVLVNGSVRLSDQHHQKVELKPNQLAVVKEGHIGEVESVNASDYTAWTKGALILHLEPLSEVFKRLERFYGENIIVSDDAGALKMKGKVDLQQSLDDLILLISATAPITCENKEGIYFINKRE